MSRAKNRSEARRKLRRRLEKMGCPPAEIFRIVEQREAIAANRYQAQHHIQRHQEQDAFLAEVEALRKSAPAIEGPDDSKYRPVHHDPLLTGAARVTGKTAKAIGRKTAATTWEYDRMENKPKRPRPKIYRTPIVGPVTTLVFPMTNGSPDD